MAHYDRAGNRVVPYKEDSTRGNSLIQPLTYKGDMLTQAWIDSRVIATLANWLEKNELYPRSMSEVARRPLEMLVESLVKNGEVDMVEDTTVAREMLQRRFRVKLNRGNRGGKNVLHNQVLSSMRGGIETDPGREMPSVEEIAAALAIADEKLRLRQKEEEDRSKIEQTVNEPST